MRKALVVINHLKRKGLIKDYAIGGGIATIFYTEPVFTYDMVKIHLPLNQTSVNRDKLTGILNKYNLLGKFKLYGQ